MLPGTAPDLPRERDQLLRRLLGIGMPEKASHTSVSCGKAMRETRPVGYDVGNFVLPVFNCN